MSQFDSGVAPSARSIEDSRRRVSAEDGRIHIEQINPPFLSRLQATGPEFGAGIKHAVKQGWVELHESGILQEADAAQ